MKKIRFLLITLLTALLISGCSSDGNPTAEDISAKTSLYNDKGTIVKLMDELKKRPELKGKDLKVFQSIDIDESVMQDRYIHNLKISLLNPETEKDIVSYEYSTAKEKKWVGPHPVKVVGGGSIKSNLVAIEDIDFDNIPVICKKTREKAAALKDLEISFVYLTLDNKDLHPYWKVKFNGKKDDSTIRGEANFDLQGNMQNYEQHVEGDKT